jgi:hypothetical protein
MGIADRLMAYLERSGTSMPDSALKNEFGAEYQQLEGVCNELLAQVCTSTIVCRQHVCFEHDISAQSLVVCQLFDHS